MMAILSTEPVASDIPGSSQGSRDRVGCAKARSAVRTSSSNGAHAALCAPYDDRRTHMPDIKIVNPATLGKPLGQYSQITRVKASEFLLIAGQVAADRSG